MERSYDYIDVIPPMRPPLAVRNSPLRWQEGPMVTEGWMEVDSATLRHRRYQNVFGVGDIAGIPKGKTAASVARQVPVAVDHIVAAIAGNAATSTYDGYTACPLITRVGRAIMVEYDYKDRLLSTYPGLPSPLEETEGAWDLATTTLKQNYEAMLRGVA